LSRKISGTLNPVDSGKVPACTTSLSGFPTGVAAPSVRSPAFATLQAQRYPGNAFGRASISKNSPKFFGAHRLGDLDG